MSRSIRVPIGVDQTGGTVAVDGDESKHQLIALALSSGESNNGFQQDINLGSAMIYGRDEPALRSRILRRLGEIFDKFEKDKLFQLMRETIAWTRGDEGELILSFSYIDIESDTQKSFAKPFTIGA